MCILILQTQNIIFFFFIFLDFQTHSSTKSSIRNSDYEYFEIKTEGSSIKSSDIDETNYSSNPESPIYFDQRMQFNNSIDLDTSQNIEITIEKSTEHSQTISTNSKLKIEENKCEHTFKCITCCKSFSRRANLIKHQSSVHMIQLKMSSKTGRNRHKRGPSPKLSMEGYIIRMQEFSSVILC